MFGDEFARLLTAILLEHDGGLGVQCALNLFLGRSTFVHAELAVGRGAPGGRRVTQNVHLHAEQVEDAADFLHVADDKAVKAANEVDAVVRHPHQRRRGAGLAVPEMLEHTEQGIVVAGDVAANEGRRMGERHVEGFRDAALLLAALDEGVQVVADHLRHAGGRDRNHLRLVQVVGIREAVDHVVQAAEHRRIFGHRRADAGRRLLEMTREMRSVVGHAALRAVHEGQRLVKAVGHKHRAQRLAGLGRIHGQRIAGKVLLLVVFGLGPFNDLLDRIVAVVELEFRLFVAEQFLVLGLAKQQFVVEDLVG